MWERLWGLFMYWEAIYICKWVPKKQNTTSSCLLMTHTHTPFGKLVNDLWKRFATKLSFSILYNCVFVWFTHFVCMMHSLIVSYVNRKWRSPIAPQLHHHRYSLPQWHCSRHLRLPTMITATRHRSTTTAHSLIALIAGNSATVGLLPSHRCLFLVRGLLLFTKHTCTGTCQETFSSFRLLSIYSRTAPVWLEELVVIVWKLPKSFQII